MKNVVSRSLLLMGIALLIAACGDGRQKIKPEHIAQNNEGVGLMGYFQYQEAHAVFAPLTALYPDWSAVKMNLCVATLNLQTEGSEARALELAREVLAVEPNNLRAAFCAGLVTLYQGDGETAMGYFQKVAEGDPTDAYAAYYVAQGYSAKQEYETARKWYERAIKLDPYLRSAYFGLFQTYQRLRKPQEARDTLQIFQKLKDNPQARLVEFKYTRMGPKGDAKVWDPEGEQPPVEPKGPLFGAARALITLPAGVKWHQGPSGISAADFEGDGGLDLFIPMGIEKDGTQLNAVLSGTDQQGGFSLLMDHPLAAVANVNTALWGDMDNDGLTDVYLCRRGPNMLFRQTEKGVWLDVTDATGTSGGESNTLDGVWLDADHDGDLDLFILNGDAPNELLNNNRDGSFRMLAAEKGIAGEANANPIGLITADLDHDRDVDLIVLNSGAPHEVYFNDRLWDYHSPDGFDAFKNEPIQRAVVGDYDCDGQVELYALNRQGELKRWAPDENGVWRDKLLTSSLNPESSLTIGDFEGSGRLAVILSKSASWEVARLDEAGLTTRHTGDNPPTQFFPAAISPELGPSLITRNGDGAWQYQPPGSDRLPFISLSFSGKEDTGNSMRSNASGIGTMFALRTGTRWSAGSSYRAHSGPGQSLQPFSVGLGGSPRLDFIAMTWSDGVFQTELGLEAGKHHAITETQRQLASCPVLFVWDGESFQFVSDILGVGGIGFAIGPGQYSEPRPWENFMLPANLIQADSDRYKLMIAEPMEEACYLDAAELVAFDLPQGWQMVLDERMGISDPMPTGEPRYYRNEQLPVKAVNDRGEIITESIIKADRKAAPIPEIDSRFLGMTRTDHVLELDFEKPIESIEGSPMLVIDGWVEYPYSQTCFAAWQANATYRAPTLEAAGKDGKWRVVWEQFGYPAGMPRQMSAPLNNLPPGTTRLRLRTNLELYYDRIAVAYAEPLPTVVVQTLPLEAAALARVGFAKRTTGPQRLPQYDDDKRTPLWDTRHMAGYYSQIGDVTELLKDQDDALAIFGPGEAVILTYPTPKTKPAKGSTRHLMLAAKGWCKDMDLYTKDGETLAPLPETGKPRERVESLHETYNTRWSSGF